MWFGEINGIEDRWGAEHRSVSARTFFVRKARAAIERPSAPPTLRASMRTFTGEHTTPRFEEWART